LKQFEDMLVDAARSVKAGMIIHIPI